MARDTESVVQRLIDIVNSGDLDRLGEVVGPDCVYHSAGYPDVHGVEGFRETSAPWLGAFPDAQITVTELLAEGDLVAYRYTFTGTHRGDQLGYAPTGRSVSADALRIDRVINGKIVEVFEIFDNYGLLQQLGVVPEILSEAQY